MNLKLHLLAEQEIREATRWYTLRSPELGQRYIDSIRNSLELLERDAEKFATLETIVEHTQIRRLLINEFPYLVVYEVCGSEVFVYAVAHASRRPNYWRKRQRSAEGS